MRNAWGEPGGIMTTRKIEFQQYRAEFALDQLPRLFLRTTVAGAPHFDQAAITSTEDKGLEHDILTAADVIASIGRVPLVHAHEWNLTPDGRCIFNTPPELTQSESTSSDLALEVHD